MPATIVKQDGTREPFNTEKLKRSLKRSGAPEEVAHAVAEKVASGIQDGDTTSAIYRKAFRELKHYERPTAARYSLKRALQELGPSGYPFEEFVAEIFRVRGYQTEVGAYLKGKCVAHEVDLVATKRREKIMAELKFHNSLHIRSDVKVAMYVKARFDDLSKENLSECWLVTNTRFSKNAVRYGKCAGLHLVSWSYPEGGCLQDLIEEAGLHPVTALTTLSKKEKQMLIGEGTALCKVLETKPEALDKLGISKRKAMTVLQEAHTLCKGSRLPR